MANDNPVFPEALARAELALVRARREALQGGLALDDRERIGRAALAISGGGIRSATFALGVLQALARLGGLRAMDYLSTVSGGGYIGSFLGSLYLPATVRENPASAGPAAAPPRDTVDHVERVLADPASPPVSWLRENGRYITPKGAGDYFYAAAIFIRNWVAVHFVFAISTLTAFLAAGLARAYLARHSEFAADVEAALRAHADGTLWWSPFAALPIAGFALALIPLGWAFWLTQSSRGRAVFLANPTLIGTLLVLAAGIVGSCQPSGFEMSDLLRPWGAYLAYAAFAAIVLWAWARWSGGNENVARNRLSTWLGAMFRTVLVLAAFALVDTLGQTVYAAWWWSGLPGLWVTLGAGIPAGIAAVAQRLAPLLAKVGIEEKGLRVPAATLAAIVGLILLALLLVLWSAVGHGILWAGGCATCADPAEPPLWPARVAFAGFAVLTVLTGYTIPFLNLSTLAQFYAARLTRAYLGASSPRRTGYRGDAPAVGVPANAQGRDVTRAQTSDDIPWSRYRPERYGGPLHFVNVTLNETVSGTSQLEQRDRKGISLAVGPCGMSVGGVHHALWDGETDEALRPVPLAPDRFAIFPVGDGAPRAVEPLTLGRWVAISGAAFTTGLGSRTRLGLSTLLALSNVRLGYWWNSGIAPGARRNRVPPRGVVAFAFELLSDLLPVQAYLGDETFARFHGPHRTRWYLSDGGHFENTAVYELLRRRVPFIVVSDAGADEGYAYSDLGNLVRKARIDYCAEIRFLTTDEIKALLGEGSPLLDVIGTLPQLQRKVTADALQGRAYAARHATLAWVRYDDEPVPGSLILVLKPTLIGDEPLDILQYHGEHPDFPQQPTGDQFFDEAQWESYRRLGDHIGELVFRAPAVAGHWAPSEMRMPAPALVKEALAKFATGL